MTDEDIIERVIKPDTLMDRDPDFTELLDKFPPSFWARKDASAVRVGWELHRLWDRQRSRTDA